MSLILDGAEPRFIETTSYLRDDQGSPTITVAGGYRVYSWTASGSITI